MNVQSLLDQLLSSGQSMLSGTPGNPAQTAAPGASKYANFGTGMLAGGGAGTAAWRKRVCKFGGKALGYGSAAALGALANKLNLPADLKTHLENEAKQALAAA